MRRCGSNSLWNASWPHLITHYWRRARVGRTVSLEMRVLAWPLLGDLASLVTSKALLLRRLRSGRREHAWVLGRRAGHTFIARSRSLRWNNRVCLIDRILIRRWRRIAHRAVLHRLHLVLARVLLGLLRLLLVLELRWIELASIGHKR